MAAEISEHLGMIHANSDGGEALAPPLRSGQSFGARHHAVAGHTAEVTEHHHHVNSYHAHLRGSSSSSSSGIAAASSHVQLGGRRAQLAKAGAK